MRKTPVEMVSSAIKGWDLRDSDHDCYEATVVPEGRVGNKNCALVKSIVEDVQDATCDNSGHFKQVCSVDAFRGQRIRMTAWAKSELPQGSLARLELCIIGDWGWYCKWNGTFDNLGHNPIIGNTDWKQYALVVDVPQNAISMSFGMWMFRTGKVWLDEFKFEIVDQNTPLTGISIGPENLNFEDSE